MVLSTITIFSLVMIYGFALQVNAASLTDAKDVISDSNDGATSVLHTITFTTGAVIPDDGYTEVTFPAGFTNILEANVTCNGTTSETVLGQVVTCAADGGAVNAGAQTILIGTTTNPSIGSYTISIVTKNSAGVEIEKASVKVYIIDNITVSATVNPSLTFAIAGIDTTGDSINGITTTATSTATQVAFGTLVSNSTSTIAQEISVGTNATDGYVVTVFQDHELRSSGGATIKSFNNAPVGQGSTTPAGWVDPTGSLTNPNTWGHMSVTSDDDSISGIDYTDGKVAGMAGTAPLVVMGHDGVADGNTQGIGKARIAYSVKVTDLQQAGDYSNTLTYVVTPQF